MWKKTENGLLHSIDDTRFKYKNRMYDYVLEDLKVKAISNNTNIGYMLENGYLNLINSNDIIHKPKKKPFKKIQFMTTCDINIWSRFNEFAIENKLTLSQAIECSLKYIIVEECKKEWHRYRIE